jgi:D-glucosaminate-6-phosphate ammonia-lyase
MASRFLADLISRRNLLKSSGVLALGGAIPIKNAAALAVSSLPDTHPLQTGPTLYESIGVRPIINCRGTFTIISGSQTLPEVKKAMDEASRHYVQMDELMEAVSKRLAEITHAEWGIVTAGCAAAITNATAACIGGSDPEKMQRLPNLAGLKNEVIMPRASRNVYDHATRMLGVTVVEVNSPEELEVAFNSRTAMVLIYSSPAAEKAPLNIENVCRVAKNHGVPVLIDAAAETPTFPNHHLQRGATMVAYSGGKCMRGPQAAGILLGQKDLVQAAWLNSAPHHAFGRSLKVGKEEIMGMLAAVEMWAKRDHDAEWKVWQSWLSYISDRVKKVPGVTTEVLQPEDLSNHAPRLQIKWDGAALNITGTEVVSTLMEGTPRITVAGGRGTRPDQMASSVTIMPYMMMPDDYKIAADALYRALSNPPKFSNPVVPSGDPQNVGGVWQVEIDYVRGSAQHRFFLEQTGGALHGVHEGETVRGDLQGKIQANQIKLSGRHPIQGTVLDYTFTGQVDGDVMHGTVSLGEYGAAEWSAKRHSYGA